MKRLKVFSFFILSFFIFVSCDGIDCTVNNVVALRMGFYSSEGTEQSFGDTLTITAAGTDSVLLNQVVGVNEVELPMSYEAKADTLSLCFGKQVVTLCLKKTNKVHFESPDCPVVVFHELEGLEYDDPAGLFDSIVIVRNSVNYEQLENVRFYFAD